MEGKDVVIVDDEVLTAGSVCEAADIVREHGRLDILLACAGHPGPVTPLADVTEEDWDIVFDVNAKGVWLCCKHAIRAMRPNGGGAYSVGQSTPECEAATEKTCGYCSASWKAP